MAKQWKPIESGAISLDCGGDNMGVLRPKEIVLHGADRALLVMSSLSMAGENRVVHLARWPEKYAICEWVEAEDPTPAIPRRVARTIRKALSYYEITCSTFFGSRSEMLNEAKAAHAWLDELLGGDA